MATTTTRLFCVLFPEGDVHSEHKTWESAQETAHDPIIADQSGRVTILAPSGKRYRIRVLSRANAEARLHGYY